MHQVIIVLLVGTAISAGIGWVWSRYYLRKVVDNGEIADIDAFNRPAYEFLIVVAVATIVGICAQLLMATAFERQMKALSRDMPVSEFVLRTLGYDDKRAIESSGPGGRLAASSAQDARTQLAVSLQEKERVLTENQLYREFLEELFGDTPGSYFEREADGFAIVSHILQRGETGSVDDRAHGEFHALLEQVGIAAPGAVNGLLIPVPTLSIWSLTHQRTVDPGSYLRLEVEGGGAALEIWRKLFNYRGEGSLSFDEKAERLALLTAYLRQYNAMFADILTAAALWVGPIQLALVALFFLTITVFAMRIGICSDRNVRKFIADNVVGESEKTNSWESYIENVPYAPINYATWAIPSIGFIGTVFGIKQSLGSAEMVVSAADRGEQILAVGRVTELLSLAFDTTLVALTFNVMLMSLYFAIRSLESRLIHK